VSLCCFAPLQLIINVACENLFYEWLKDRDKLGGQHKIPRLSNQRDYLEQLKEMQSKNNPINDKNTLLIVRCFNVGLPVDRKYRMGAREFVTPRKTRSATTCASRPVKV
jgi:hypothetical protein